MLLLTTDELKKSSDHFIYKLFRYIHREHSTENVVVSPKSIELCLGLILFATEGETYKEISEFLLLDESGKFEIAESFYEYFSNCRITSLIKTSLNIFPNIQYDFKSQFSEILRIALRAVPEYVNYGNNKEAAGHINCWTRYNTCNQIKEIVRPSSFRKDTGLVLVSVVYLKASWRIPFDPKNTHDGRFFVRIGKSIPVYMMNVKGEFLTTELPELDAIAIELGFDYSDISMVIILPNDRAGLSKMIRATLRLNVFAIFEELKPERIELSLPRFQTEFGLELTDKLRQSGLRSIFSDTAKFIPFLKYERNIKVSNIFQKVCLNVNEFGAEVESPTEIPRRKKISADKRIVVDRPFLYIIKDTTNMYFMGYVVKATKRTHF